MDEANQCIWFGARRVDLLPKAFLVLQRLRAQPNQIVTKRELLDAVWPDTHVTEGVLKLSVNQLREALQDDARQPRFIETVHRRGYRWIGDLQGAGFGDQEPELENTPASQLPTPNLVGREAALSQLERAFSLAMKASRQMVFIAGEPGIGKTALIDEFTRLLGPRVSRVRSRHPSSPNTPTPNTLTPILLARGQCADGYGASEAFMPLLEAVESLCRESASGEPVELLRRVAPTWLLQLPRLLKAGEQDELRQLLAGSTGERMARDLVSFIEELTVDRTLVLVVEDLHWSDHATVGALAALATRRGPMRLLAIVSYRQADAIALQHPMIKLKHELAAKGQCLEITLPGLPSDAVDAYLGHRFPNHHLPQDLASQLQAETSGNPLFLLNALDHFVQRGWLEERDGAWQCTVDLATLAGAVPDGTREMIAFRLQQLSPSEIEVLETASVFGASFATHDVAAVLEREPADIETVCAQLAQAAHFLGDGQVATWPDGSTGMQHGFRHALYQQVLYRRVTPARRRLLHRRSAESLERGFAGVTGTIAPQLAFHFERAGELERAVSFRREAAAQDLDRYAYDQAVANLRIALELLQAIPAGASRDALELTLQIALLKPMLVTFKMSSSELSQTIERIQALTLHGETTPELLEALSMLVIRHVGEDSKLARSAAEQMLRRAAAVPWGDVAKKTAHFLLGLCQVIQGEVRVAIENFEQVVDLPEISPDMAFDPATIATEESAFAHCLLGQPSKGRDLVRTAIRRAQALQHPPTFVHAMIGGIRIGVITRDDHCLAEAAALVASIPAALQARWRPWEGIVAGFLAACRGDAGGVARMLAGNESLIRERVPHYRALCGLMLTTGLIRCRRHDEAQAQLAQELAHVRNSSTFWPEAELHRLHGEICSARRAEPQCSKKQSRDLAEAAEACFRRAIDLARSQETKWWELRAAVSLATLLAGSDGAVQARAQLNSVYRSFDQGFELPDLRAARELLKA